MTSPTPTQQHIDYWLKRQREQQASDQSLADEARMLLNQIVSLLVNEYGARRIILFGSLARRRFAADSDIDLAVEGLDRGRYFEALAAASRLAQRWVDLKPLEDLDEHFKQRVLATGECIYAQQELESKE